MNEVPSIYWFRSDLRLTDLPGLSAASAAGPVLACYVYDELSDDAWTPGSASRWWLRRSLSALSNELEKRGGNLIFMQGRPETVLAKLACEVGADTVFCSREYEPCSDDIERRVAESLTENGRRLKRYGGTLLWEPEQVRTRTDTPFKVFTPFWKCCLTLPEPGLAAGGPLRFVQGQSASSASLKSFDLDCADDTGARWAEYWSPGSIGAKKSLKDFEESALDGYGEGRDFPERAATSLLSPHLRFGEISPHRVYHSIKDAARRRPDLQSEADDYLRELGWREFSRHLLYHHPSLPEQPFRSEFARFPWCGAQESLVAWQEGKTGYPIVDAGMRELKQTGYMHNRVRMI
ncbi:MAG: deoxyribodipyrimidine photo-lyase, partial [Proteobacteria bacterium]|nr:deoxyribodipyrimidine photo-lyase [Pseudomonadota bacterium]